MVVYPNLRVLPAAIREKTKHIALCLASILTIMYPASSQEEFSTTASGSYEAAPRKRLSPIQRVFVEISANPKSLWRQSKQESLALVKESIPAGCGIQLAANRRKLSGTGFARIRYFVWMEGGQYHGNVSCELFRLDAPLNTGYSDVTSLEKPADMRNWVKGHIAKAARMTKSDSWLNLKFAAVGKQAKGRK